MTKKHIKSIFILTFFAVLLSGCVSLAGKVENPPVITNSTLSKNLFIVVLSAVRYNDTIGHKDHLYCENLWDNLRPLGTLCTNLRNDGQTFTAPSQASLLTGKWEKFSDPEDEDTPPSNPTLFEYYQLSLSSSDLRCVFAPSNPALVKIAFSGKKEFGMQYGPVIISGKKDAENEAAVYEDFIAYLNKNHPSFAYLSLGSGKPISKHRLDKDCLVSKEGLVDSCGGEEHLNAYYEAIITMDNIIFDLWNRIQSDPLYKDKSTLIILSDHGRHTSDYSCWGDNCAGCSKLFMLAIGPGIKKDYVSSKKRRLTDICPTAGRILGIDNRFTGANVMSEIFE